MVFDDSLNGALLLGGQGIGSSLSHGQGEDLEQVGHQFFLHQTN